MLHPHDAKGAPSTISKKLLNELVFPVVADIIDGQQICTSESPLHFEVPFRIARGVDGIGNREEIGWCEP